jgi:hypothetical protein
MRRCSSRAAGRDDTFSAATPRPGTTCMPRSATSPVAGSRPSRHPAGWPGPAAGRRMPSSHWPGPDSPSATRDHGSPPNARAPTTWPPAGNSESSRRRWSRHSRTRSAGRCRPGTFPPEWLATYPGITGLSVHAAAMRDPDTAARRVGRIAHALERQSRSVTIAGHGRRARSAVLRGPSASADRVPLSADLDHLYVATFGPGQSSIRRVHQAWSGAGIPGHAGFL